MKTIFIVAIILLSIFILGLVIYVFRKKLGEPLSRIHLYIDVAGILIATIVALFSGMYLGNSAYNSTTDFSSTDNITQEAENDDSNRENTANPIVTGKDATENAQSNKNTQKATDLALPSDGSVNISFVGQGLNLTGCKIAYITLNSDPQYVPFKETLISEKYDGNCVNITISSENELYFCAWKNNELIGSSYDASLQPNSNYNITIFPCEKMGVPAILRFEGKNNLNISGCMITMTINDSTTLNTAIAEAYNGESILKFVKPGNYELYCWKDNILIAKTKWNFDDAWSIHTVYFYPLD